MHSPQNAISDLVQKFEEEQTQSFEEEEVACQTQKIQMLCNV